MGFEVATRRVFGSGGYQVRKSTASAPVVPPVMANGIVLAGDSVSAPDSAGLSITGDIDVRLKLSLADWSPAADNYLVLKWAGSYLLVILAGGQMQFALHTATQFPEYSISNSALSITDGATKWIRATRSGTTYAQYISDDGSSWTTVPCTTSNASASAILDGADAVTLSGSGATGTLYRAVFMAGIDGTIGGDFDPSQVVKVGARNPTTYTDAQGNIWTPSGAAWSWG